MAKRKDKNEPGAKDATKQIKKLKKRRDKFAGKLDAVKRELRKARRSLEKHAGSGKGGSQRKTAAASGAPKPGGVAKRKRKLKRADNGPNASAETNTTRKERGGDLEKGRRQARRFGREPESKAEGREEDSE